MVLILHVAAFICFVVGCTDIVADRARMISAGLACWALTLVIGMTR